jgi:hypothetical protein
VGGDSARFSDGAGFGLGGRARPLGEAIEEKGDGDDGQGDEDEWQFGFDT